MRICPKCKHYIFSGEHECFPFIVEYDGESETLYGYDFDDVVEEFARTYNEYDRPAVNDMVFDSPVTVTDRDGLSKRFNCYTEAVLEYYVKELP